MTSLTRMVFVLCLAVVPAHAQSAPTAEDPHREAYEAAIACAADVTPAVKFADISWEVSPELRLSIAVKNAPPVKAEGYWSVKDSTVWIAKPYATTRWVNVHEALHAVLGTNGHPDEYFRRCRLLPEQNR